MREVILYSKNFRPDKVFRDKIKKIYGNEAEYTDIDVRTSEELISYIKENLHQYYDHESYYVGEDNTLAWIDSFDESKYWTIKNNACHVYNGEKVNYLDVVFMDENSLDNLKYNFVDFV